MTKFGTKIIELFIDDDFDEAGIEAISLVSKPAHEEEWMAFNSQKKFEEEPEFSPYKIVEADFCNNNPKLKTLGEPYGQLIKEGWSIVKVEKITPQMVHKMNQERFSSPNDPSDLDTDETRIRFKYFGPQDELNREFCADMMSANRVYRKEDIDDLTDQDANGDFGSYDIFLWRGSYNCRHQWVKLTYKKEGRIINNGNSTRGLEETDGLGTARQPDTRTESTINSETPQNQWKPGVPRTGNFTEAFSDGTPLTEKQKMVFAFDDDKRIVVGAAMVPNKMIHRYDSMGNLYYVFFSKQSIKKMSDKFLKEKRTDETSVEHDGMKLGSDKVFITESWVSEDPVLDKSHFYGFELPAGTWFVAMKVQDDKVWKMIKDKSLTGFSVEGLFAEKSMFSKEDKQINQIRTLINQIKDYDE
jgi:hypothetical protein